MTKKTKARSTTKPSARSRSPKKPAPKRTARPKSRRTEKKRTCSLKVRRPNPSDLKRPVPGEPVRIQPPPEFVHGRHDETLEETAAPPHIDEPARDEAAARPETDESAREAAMERERQRLRDVPERRRPDRAAVDANRWVHRQPNERRGSAWQARGHST